MLAPGLGLFGLYHCLYPSGLAVNHISTNLTWRSIPFHQHLPPKFIHTSRRAQWTLGCHLRCCHPYSTGLRRGDCRPLQDTALDLLEPFWSLLKGVFRVIFPLKGEPRRVQPIKLHSSQEFTLKNASVQLSIHSPIYCAYMVHSLGRCAAPSHQEFAPKLDNPLV